MIIDENIKIRVTNKTKKHYSDLGYDVSSEFIIVNVFHLKNSSNYKIRVKCDICFCDRILPFNKYLKNTNYNSTIYTCMSCSFIKNKKTNLDRYGVENPSQVNEFKNKKIETFIKNYGVKNPQLDPNIREKTMNTVREKYGVDFTFQSNDIREKSYITNIKKYGYTSYSKTEEFKDKMRKTCLEKYGSNSPIENLEILDKCKKTNLKKYGFEYQISSPDVKRKIKEKTMSNLFRENFNISKDNNYLSYLGDSNYLFKCDIGFEHDFKINTNNYYSRIGYNIPLCTICYPIGDSVSIKEEELFKFIKLNHSGDVLQSYRDGLEIDIYLPELKLGFEFNGLYWHSNKFKDKSYHVKKNNYFFEKGISLFHIWEDDWIYKQDIVKSMIINKLGKTPNKIFARKCKVVEITDNKLIRDFLEKNHIQGFVGSKIKLGLFFENELVSLMTFGNLRKSLGQNSQKGSYEMLRFCNKLNTNIVGGASKLLKHFINTNEVKEVISYSDSSRSDGNLYKQLGFKMVSETEPNYYWIVDGIRKHRFNFRKDKLVKEGANTNKTEIEIMNDRGYYRIFDCGNKKWNL